MSYKIDSEVIRSIKLYSKASVLKKDTLVKQQQLTKKKQKQYQNYKALK